jgi:hypothetical protein
MIPLVLFSGLLDRLRGMGAGHVFSAIQGAVIGYLLNLAGLTLAVFSLCWLLGASIGWQTPLSSYWNDLPQNPANALWWQVDGFAQPGGELESVILRGGIWGMCLLPVAYFKPDLWMMIPVCMVSFWLSPYFWRRYRKNANAWGWMEATRGALMGLGAYLIGVSG